MYYSDSEDFSEGNDSMDDGDDENPDALRHLILLRRLLNGIGYESSEDSEMEGYSSDEEQPLQKIQVEFPDKIYRIIFMYVPSFPFRRLIFANKKFKQIFDNEEFFKERFVNEFCKYKRELIGYTPFGPSFKIYVNDQATINLKLEIEAPYPQSFTWKNKWVTRVIYSENDSYYSRKCSICFKKSSSYYSSAIRTISELKVHACAECEKNCITTVPVATKKVCLSLSTFRIISYFYRIFCPVMKKQD